MSRGGERIAGEGDRAGVGRAPEGVGPAPSASGAGAIPVLLNPRAGRGADAAALQDDLRAAGMAALVEVVPEDRMEARIRSLAGVPVLGVAGGDGTQRLAAGGLRGTPTALVPIPVGRLNHFARRVGIRDSAAAARAAAAARGFRPVPLGVLGGERVFLNTAVVGAYAALVRTRERLRPWLSTWPAAVVAGLALWARWPRFELTLRLEGRVIRCATPLVWIGTGPGTFPVPQDAPLAGPGDGLEVIVLPGGSRRHGLLPFRALAGRRRGRSPEEVGLERLHAREIEIDAAHPIPLTLDAEPFLVEPPARLVLEAGALLVV